MQGRFALGALVLLGLSISSAAQTAPGYGSLNQPLVTTPILTLGNGLTTGPTITYSGSVTTTSPLDISSLQPRVVLHPDEAAEKAEREVETAWNRFGAPSLDSSYAATDFAVSLGDLTKSLKVNRPEYANRTFTNEDIHRIAAQDSGRTGIIEARTAKGPIVPRAWSEDSFQPETGIANQPYRESPQGTPLSENEMRMHFLATTPSLEAPASIPDPDKSALPAGEPE